ncbi:MAG TPA: Asp23/Gls24 family envelope stress response protein [Ktedonobacterales bacterium]
MAAQSKQSPTAGPPQGTASPMRTTNARGKIEVSTQAIATVAARALADSYGVVGIAAKRSRPGRVDVLRDDHYARGVDVRFGQDHVTVELNVVLEYGLRITNIAHNIMSNVKFAVERTFNINVVRVNVNVLAVRLSKEE